MQFIQTILTLKKFKLKMNNAESVIKIFEFYVSCISIVADKEYLPLNAE